MHNLQKPSLLLITILACALPVSGAAADTIPPDSAPDGLRCSLLTASESAPITDPNPRFSWHVHSGLPGARQTAYRIRLHASAPPESSAPLMWDTQKTASAQSVAVPYTGPDLASNTSYSWQVQTWDRENRPGAWSNPYPFRTGALRTRIPGILEQKPEDRVTALRVPIRQQKIAPAELTQTAPGRWFADFGQAAFAGLELQIDSPEAGRVLTVHLGEALSAPHTINPKPGGSIRCHSVSITLEAGRHSYVVPLTPADARLMPPGVGPVMPFRYVEIENAPGPLTAKDITQLAAHYAFDEDAARFACSDARLNAVWKLCRHSIEATSFGGVFVDGDRERKPYEADAYINQLGWYCCTDDVTLPRYTHEYLILHPTWPAEWILFSPLIAWEDYRYTGDATSLIEFYADLKAKTLLSLARPDGLISTVPPVPVDVFEAIHLADSKSFRAIVDWPVSERDHYEFKPINTVVNAFHCRALWCMVNLAQAMNRPDEADQFQKQYQRAVQALNDKLIDPMTGLYVDGEGSLHSSLHANMFPLAFGLVPAGRIASVTAFVKSKGMACSVYGAQFLLDGLFDNGQAATALELMTANTDRSWTHMIEQVGTTITLEAWDNKYKPNQDWNHAWGAAPANLLPRKVLGIEPLEPGFRRILIQPRLGNLKWAEGKVPTIRGPVSLRVDQTDAEWRINMEIPANTSARIGIPTPRGQVLLDGKAVTLESVDNMLFLDPVGSGKHVIRCRSK